LLNKKELKKSGHGKQRKPKRKCEKENVEKATVLRLRISPANHYTLKNHPSFVKQVHRELIAGIGVKTEGAAPI